jgi:benzil reductase ((S)-benzoin forming)
MHCYIVTGAARGLGLGFCRAIAQRKGHLVALGRQETVALAELGRALPGYRFEPVDLANTLQTQAVAEEVMGSLAAINWSGIYLINNAGVVEPVARAGAYDDAALARCLAVNLTAAMQVGNAFIRHFQAHAADKRIFNISSGAGRNAYPGWSAYCSAKAGLDMYSRCVGLEQDGRPGGIRIASVAPGIVDTGMQADIRRHSAVDFPIVEQFIGYKSGGDLADPDTRAQDLLKLLHSGHVGFGSILNIRDFL